MKIYSIQTYSIAALFLTLAHLTASCKESVSNKPDNIKNVSQHAKILAKPPATFADTLEITEVSAIFFNPDSIQLRKIETINQKMIYESMKHDCFYQMRNARSVLKQYWPRVRIFETNDSRFLRFTKDDKTTTFIDLDTKKDICGILLFDKKKEPLLVDMTNLNTALESYFGKKN